MSTINKPEYVFELTNTCTYHCSICSREKMTRNQEVMSTDLFKNIVNEEIAHGLKYVRLVGYSSFDSRDQMYETPDTLIYPKDSANTIGVSGPTKILLENLDS